MSTFDRLTEKLRRALGASTTSSSAATPLGGADRATSPTASVPAAASASAGSVSSASFTTATAATTTPATVTNFSKALPNPKSIVSPPPLSPSA